MAGSSTCLNAAVPAPLDVLAVTHYPHVIPGPYTTETGINTTGAAVAWLAGLLYGGRSGRPSAADYARLDAEAGRVRPGADGVIALPVFGDGERTDPTFAARSPACPSATNARHWPEPSSKGSPSPSTTSSTCCARAAPRSPSCASRAATPA